MQRAQVAASVLVQAAATEAETEYLLGVASHFPEQFLGVVGWADFTAVDAIARIARLAENKKLVGLRPMLQDISDVNWILNPALAPVLQFISDKAIPFDALVTSSHLPAVIKLAQRYPLMTIIIDHCAKPSVDNAPQENWREAMATLAEYPNVVVKMSGLPSESAEPFNKAGAAQFLDLLLQYFGADRILWGSDWPVVTQRSNYCQWLTFCIEFCQQRLTSKQCEAVFALNCHRIYNLARPAPDSAPHPLILLHERDNVLIARRNLAKGDVMTIDGVEIAIETDIAVGHKLARHTIAKEEKVIKYGAAIGVAKVNISQGAHVHLNNLRSDYIPSHTRSSVNHDTSSRD
nr:amidohydrolase family protein [Alteromonas pelagimontana]